jgi:hypothetical protein
MRTLENEVGEFLREVERTAMTKSFKMVVLKAMCGAGAFRNRLPMADLVIAAREYFTQERHRDDVAGTEVEAVSTAEERTWRSYLQRNPIAAWTGANAKNSSRFFAWDEPSSELCYVGPMPQEDRQVRFVEAVADRVEARLETYWQRPGPGRFVFNVIPAGSGADSDNLCIMFGTNRDGLPAGWHLVRINGRHLYGNFVKVALNVLKDRPTDSKAVPNVLTAELMKLFEGTSGRKQRVRFLRQTSAEVWEIQRA